MALTMAVSGMYASLMLACCTAVAAGACRGVFWDKKSRRWRCQLGHKNKKIFLGYFGVAEDAARAYDQKLVELHGGAGGCGVHHTSLCIGISGYHWWGDGHSDCLHQTAQEYLPGSQQLQWTQHIQRQLGLANPVIRSGCVIWKSCLTANRQSNSHSTSLLLLLYHCCHHHAIVLQFLHPTAKTNFPIQDYLGGGTMVSTKPADTSAAQSPKAPGVPGAVPDVPGGRRRSSYAGDASAKGSQAQHSELSWGALGLPRSARLSHDAGVSEGAPR